MCVICNREPCICGDDFFMYESKRQFEEKEDLVEPDNLINEDNDIRDEFDILDGEIDYDDYS